MERGTEQDKTGCVVKLDKTQMKLRAKWKLLHNEHPWMVYRLRVSKRGVLSHSILLTFHT